MQSLQKWITNRLGANILVFKREASKSAVSITTLPTGYCDGCLSALGALKSRHLPFCKLKIKKKNPGGTADKSSLKSLTRCLALILVDSKKFN